MANEQKRLPQPGELAIMQISKIMPFGAYCKLLEFGDVEVFLPIKEVSSGWIKNIHEFIHEGQKHVCKVIYYDKERGTLDVSIKRVTPQDSKQKLGAYNLEKRLNALFLQAIRASNMEPQKAEIVNTAAAEFRSYTELVRAAAAGSAEFEASKMPKKVKESLLKLVEASKKKKRYIVSYIMKLSTFSTKTGATELRGILLAIKEKGIEATYISAPKYHLKAEGKDYADAEGKIRAAAEIVNSRLKRGSFEIEKEKIRKDKEDLMASI